MIGIINLPKIKKDYDEFATHYCPSSHKRPDSKHNLLVSWAILLTDKKSSMVLLGEMSFWGAHWASGFQTKNKGSKTSWTSKMLQSRSNFVLKIDKNWWNWKLSLFTGYFCHFRAQVMGQNCDYFQKKWTLCS